MNRRTHQVSTSKLEQQDDPSRPSPPPLSFTASGTLLHCSDAVAVDCKYKVVFVGPVLGIDSPMIKAWFPDIIPPETAPIGPNVSYQWNPLTFRTTAGPIRFNVWIYDNENDWVRVTCT